MGNLLACIEDNIFNPVESKIMPPSIHAQEEKYRIACEHHKTAVEALARAQKEVGPDDLVEKKKTKRKKLTKKLSGLVIKTDKKRKLVALERCKLHVAEALEIKAESKFALDAALKQRNEFIEDQEEKRRQIATYLEEEKEKRRVEEERLKVQRRLDAERVSTTGLCSLSYYLFFPFALLASMSVAARFIMFPRLCSRSFRGNFFPCGGGCSSLIVFKSK